MSVSGKSNSKDQPEGAAFAVCCGNCAFAAELDDDKRFILCRERPPLVVVVPSAPTQADALKGQQVTFQPQTHFPVLRKAEWCGSFLSHREFQMHMESRLGEMSKGTVPADHPEGPQILNADGGKKQ